MLKRTAPNGRCTLAYAKAGGGNEVWASGGPAKWQAMPVLAQAAAVPQQEQPKEAEISDEGAKLLDMVRMIRTGQ
jgi:hypothetical protein